MIGHSRRALRRGARSNAPSAAVSTVPPTRHVRCVYLTLFGSGLAGLGEKTPSAALNWLTAIRGLTQFAVRVGLLRDDPTVGIERAKLPNTGGFHSWSEEEIARYEAKHPIGSRARMAMALVLYTALRRGDIVTLGPQHVRDGTITVRPRKTTRTTGTTLHIPVHPALAEILAKTPTKHLTFLITEAGTPFRPPSLSWRFRTGAMKQVCRIAPRTAGARRNAAGSAGASFY